MLATADGGLAALQRCDVVVKTPGLSRYRPEVAQLSAAGIPVVGGLGLWLAEADLRRVLCVTGTKGKSTTSSLTGHLLAGLGYRCMVGGNIGAVPYDPGNAGDFDYWVIEVSSYQATDLPVSPPVVAVTSLHPDHLDWHGEQWSSTTGTSCPRAPSPAPNSPWPTATAPCSASAPRCSAPGSSGSASTTTPARTGWTRSASPAGIIAATRSSPAAAWLALGVPGAADATALRAAAAGYQPLPSRLTPVGTAGGVTFVDDSLSTNVLPTLAALDAFPGRRIALIVGGHDRGIDYAPLAAGVVARDAPTYVLTLPDSGPRIRAQIEAAAPPPAADRLRGRDRLPGPARRRRGGIPLGPARRHRAAVPGRAELRRVQGLPRPRRGLRPRRPRRRLTRGHAPGPFGISPCGRSPNAGRPGVPRPRTTSRRTGASRSRMPGAHRSPCRP